LITGFAIDTSFRVVDPISCHKKCPSGLADRPNCATHGDLTANRSRERFVKVIKITLLKVLSQDVSRGFFRGVFMRGMVNGDSIAFLGSNDLYIKRRWQMDLYEEIAKVAYELYEKSGYIDGRDLDNWLEAERVVMARLTEEKKKSEKKTGTKTAGKKGKKKTK
jgi:hypothetical protein